MGRRYLEAVQRDLRMCEQGDYVCQVFRFTHILTQWLEGAVSSTQSMTMNPFCALREREKEFLFQGRVSI